MGNGWHEWPLVLFTVLGQCVAGGVIGTGLVWMTNEAIAVVSCISFAASFFSLAADGRRLCRFDDAPRLAAARL